MIGTWLSKSEKETMTTVNDDELNEILQEVREKFDNKFFVQTTRYDNRNWFDKLTGNYLKTGRRYTLYVCHENHFDAQVINFAPIEGEWSINTLVTKGQLITYFFGLLAGKQFANKL